jgi:hypothetical protein
MLSVRFFTNSVTTPTTGNVENFKKVIKEALRFGVFFVGFGVVLNKLMGAIAHVSDG